MKVINIVVKSGNSCTSLVIEKYVDASKDSHTMMRWPLQRTWKLGVGPNHDTVRLDKRMKLYQRLEQMN